VATAGGWTLLGSIAVMLGIVFIEAIIYAFFG
jgi:hypothetical protein